MWHCKRCCCSKYAASAASAASAAASAKYLEHAKPAEGRQGVEVAPKVCNDRENCAAAMGATVEQPRRRQLSPDSVSGETIFGNISRPFRGPNGKLFALCQTRLCQPECSSSRWLMDFGDCKDVNARQLAEKLPS